MTVSWKGFALKRVAERKAVECFSNTLTILFARKRAACVPLHRSKVAKGPLLKHLTALQPSHGSKPSNHTSLLIQ
jgi:hypothetical protein